MKRTALLLAVLVIAFALVPHPVRAQSSPPRHAAAEFGLGTGAVLCTFVYGTVKVLYAAVGTVTGGLGYVFSGGSTDVARKIIQPAVRGDYVITPEHLTMERTLVFAGADPAETY